MSKVVINTSPWIALSILELTPILPKLFSGIYMPNGVKEEILFKDSKSVGIEELGKAQWINYYQVKQKNLFEYIKDLHKGELEIIVTAKELNIDLVMLDEKLARYYAKIHNLNVIGTLGFLLKAKKQNLIGAVKPLIQNLLDNNMWISKDIIQLVLKKANENNIT